MGGGSHGITHVLEYVSDFQSSMLCIKIGCIIYKVI